MRDEEKDPMWDEIRENYNVPGDVPRAAIWTAIAGRIGDAAESGTGSGSAEVIDLAARRADRGAVTTGPRRERMAGWAVAAAAVLVMGIGIGRMTAPGAPSGGTVAGASRTADGPSLQLAARDHLGRTESLLTMVRADARAGRMDPATASWANDLLSETRLLLDTDPGQDAATRDLLLDLELILIQISAISETGSRDEAMTRTELELALRSLEDGEVLPRIQAVLPAGMAGA